MKILLAIPPDGHLIHREAVIPLGIAYINGTLRASGFDVLSCNLNYIDDELFPYLEKLISENDVGIVMSGGTSYNYAELKTVFECAKSVRESIITIGGGAGYTSSPYLFAEMTNPDYVILGEGEVTAVELIRCLESCGDIRGVEGIMYKTPDGYVKNQDRPLIEDIDSIAFPSYEGFAVDRLFEDLNDYDESAHFDYEAVENPRVLPMLFSRSCPYNCKFCFHTIGRTYRTRSLDNFFQELDDLISKYQLTGITIMDEFFGMKRETISRFCDRIESYHLKWFAELRVDIITNDLVARMKRAGCTNILLGIESMDDDILRDMNKHTLSTQNESALDIIYNHGITISGYFIIASPQETLESFFRTFDWWNHHRKYQVEFTHLQLCPRSEYYLEAKEAGIIGDERLFIERRLPELNYSKLSNFEWDKVRRIVRLTRIDTVMHGRIEAHFASEKNESMRLTCRHCGNTFSRTLERKDGFNWKTHVMKCPACEHKSIYRLHDNSSAEFEREIFNQHAMNCAHQVFLSDWLSLKGYRSVVLYGTGFNLAFMQQEIARNGGNIQGVMYRDERKLKVYETFLFSRVISEDELPFIDGVDAVILCQTTEFNQTFKYLRSIGYSGKVDSMVNAILQHDFYIEANVW